MKNSFLWQVSELQITYRTHIQPADRPHISSSQDAENVFRAHWSEDIELVEEFNMLFLNKTNQVIGFLNLSKGGMSGTVVDVKLVFAAALKALASSIIVAHNHPSSCLIPSQADIDLTRRLKQAGGLLDLPLYDHLILSPYGYFSFADEGEL